MLDSSHILRSFGATISVFDFLTQSEVIKLQVLHPWIYGIGIGRVQIIWRLPKRYFYFASPFGTPYEYTCIKYDAAFKTCSLLIHGTFKFHKHYTIQVDTSLYTI